MKYFIPLFIAAFFLSGDISAQQYIFHYNPYSGYNTDQLNLALDQSKKMKRNGIIATGVGTGMLAGGALLMFDGLYPEGEVSLNVTRFASGLGLMCLSGFPLGYGFVAWITGNEQIKQIEIELLASENRHLKLKPTLNGFGLACMF